MTRHYGIYIYKLRVSWIVVVCISNTRPFAYVVDELVLADLNAKAAQLARRRRRHRSRHSPLDLDTCFAELHDTVNNRFDTDAAAALVDVQVWVGGTRRRAANDRYVGREPGEHTRAQLDAHSCSRWLVSVVLLKCDRCCTLRWGFALLCFAFAFTFVVDTVAHSKGEF